MSSPEVIYACRWLIRDTFRQALANRIFWVMLAANAVVIFFCLSISIVDGATLQPAGDLALDRPHGHVSLAFGAWRLPLFRDGQAMVHFILLALGEGAFGIMGTLLALILTAGFLPEFLRPSNASVVLSKPAPRWVLLLGKYLGVLAFVGSQAAIFTLGTWLAIGLRTGFWVDSYLWGIPLLVLQFAAMYGFSALLAVWSRSTLVCVVGSVLFWFLCTGMNFARHALLALESHVPPASRVLHGFAEIGYWIMPKPIDLGMILYSALKADNSFSFMPELEKAQQLGAFYPELSVISSLVFTVGVLAVAARQLADTDY